MMKMVGRKNLIEMILKLKYMIVGIVFEKI